MRSQWNILKVAFSHVEKRISLKYEICMQSGIGFARFNDIIGPDVYGRPVDDGSLRPLSIRSGSK